MERWQQVVRNFKSVRGFRFCHIAFQGLQKLASICLRSRASHKRGKNLQKGHSPRKLTLFTVLLDRKSRKKAVPIWRGYFADIASRRLWICIPSEKADGNTKKAGVEPETEAETNTEREAEERAREEKIRERILHFLESAKGIEEQNCKLVDDEDAATTINAVKLDR